MKYRHLLVLPFLLFPAASQAAPLTAEQTDAMNAVYKSLNSAWAECTIKNRLHLITRVVRPSVRPNSFAQPLGPTEPQELGYYDFITFDTNLPKLKFQRLPISEADIQNGVQVRYAVQLFLPAYRVYNMQTGWSPWDSGRSYEQNNINFVNYTATRVDSKWTATPQYNIMPLAQGAILERPACDSVPKG